MADGSDAYRAHSRRAIRQGDIAFAEFVQLRSRSGDRLAPGARQLSGPQVPYYGEPHDFAAEFIGLGGSQEQRLLRLWPATVMVLHQNCELDFADPQDSRLIVAPIVSSAEWPDGPWDLMRRNVLPGYFYLPELDADAASGLGLPEPWAESVVTLAGSTQSSVGIIKPRRLMSLSQARLPDLQDSLSRFYTTRGLADVDGLRSIVGRRVIRIADTGTVVGAPSALIKVYFGERDGTTGGDDEGTYCFWGVRRPAERTGA